MSTARLVDVEQVMRPEWTGLSRDFIRDFRLVLAKARLSLAVPDLAPLPADGRAPETLLVEAALSEADPQALGALRLQGQRIGRSPVVDHPSGLKLDLRSPEAVLDHIRPARRGGVAMPRTHGGMRVRSGHAPLPVSELSWRLTHVLCETETGATAFGSDQLYVGSTAIDAFGNTARGPVLDLGGGWDSGNALPFDRLLSTTSLSHGVGWPRTYYLMVAMSVRGSDRLYEFLDKVVSEARKEAVAYLATAVGSYVGFQVGWQAGLIVGGSLGGPIGAAAGALVGALVAYLAGELIGALWDEIKGFFKGATKLFAPVTVQVDLPAHGALFAGGKAVGTPLTLGFSGHHGRYEIKVRPALGWLARVNPSAASRLPNRIELASAWGSESGHRLCRLRTWTPEDGWGAHVFVSNPHMHLSADSPIALVAPMPWRLDIVAIDRSGAAKVIGRSWKLVGQSDWSEDDLPTPMPEMIFGTAIAAVSRGTDLVDLFVTARDGGVYSAAQEAGEPGGKWKGWWRIGDAVLLPGTPIAAISRSEGRLDLFAIAPDGRVISAAYGPDGHGTWDWTGWFPILDETFVPGSAVTAVSRRTDQIDLFATALDGTVRTAAWAPDWNGGKWGGWWRVTADNGQFEPGTPVSAVSRGEPHLDIFAVGLDGRVWTAAWGPQTGGTWAGWWGLGTSRFHQGTPIASVSRGPSNIDLFIGGVDGQIWSHAWDGSAWKEFAIPV